MDAPRSGEGPPEGNKEPLNQMKSAYRTLDQRLSINEEDHPAVVILKIGLRLVAIGFLVLLSPFLLIVLLITFMAAL